jgi:hypothetical protein
MMDACSEEFMGYQVGATLEACYCIMSLRKALKKCDERQAEVTFLTFNFQFFPVFRTFAA